ncbi:MAG: hypothetical protein ACQERD_09875 [Campylobacterota bacterium]
MKKMIVNNDTLKSKIDLYYTNILNKSERIFTALDRDPHSPTYGCFDRDYWHYKIRDFSSMVLHQASLSVDFLYNWKYDKNIYYDKKVLQNWVSGSIQHWNAEQLQSGSFNEYYPNEEGYPPTAFSLYTMAILIYEKGYVNNDSIKHIEKASSWILENSEKEASNQEAIGICGVYLSSLIDGVNVDQKKLEKRFNEFFASQDQEGWFPEYHGPDIGYLSVTMDALWDYYRFSQDKRALEAMRKAADFIELFFTNSGNLPVMINSRNTDYVVPYGIFNLAKTDKGYHSLFYKVLKKITEPFNYLETTDDRYLCHYVYTSSTRAIEALEYFKQLDTIKLKELKSQRLSNSGIIINKTNRYTTYINTKKGGIVYIYDQDNLIYTNHGFRYIDDKIIGVTHWLTGNNKVDIKNVSGEINILIEGSFTSRKWLVPTPLKHIILRAVTFTLGKKIIPILKKFFIFGDKKIDINFDRQIVISKNNIQLIDKILSDTLDLSKVEESPYYSLRHVSSAVRFTPDELLWKDSKYKANMQLENNILLSSISIGLK